MKTSSKISMCLLFLLIFSVGTTITIFSYPNTNVVEFESNLNISQAVKREEVGIYDEKLIKEIPNTIDIGNNWSETAKIYDWCSGTGTSLDPYIIENIKIDAKDARYCIKINKGKNFIIRNCIFTNTSGEGEKTSAIYVIEAEEGMIENNNFTYCKTGVFSEKAKIINLRYNSFIGDFNGTSGNGRAFWAYEGEELTISGNYILDYYCAIGIWFSKENDISLNTIINYEYGKVVEAGIYLSNVNNSGIIENDLYGVNDKYDDSLDIQTASANGGYDAFLLEYCNNILVSGNRLFDSNGNLIGEESLPSVPFNFGLLILVISIGIAGFLTILFYIRKKER